MRICSFLPSATEIVYLLDLGDSLYGVSHECDFPPGAADKPKVVRSRFDPSTMSSAEIDRLVTEMMMRGESVYEVDAAVLAESRPDLVITQRLCEVCAVSFEDVQDAVARLEPIPKILSLDPHSVGDVLSDIRMVARETNVEVDCVVSELEDRVGLIRKTVKSAQARPTVVCVEWMDPVIAAGHWVPEMVEIAGGSDALVEPGAPSARIEFKRLRDADPDIVVLMPCGMDVAQSLAEFESLPNRSDWFGLGAFDEGRAYVVDSGALFSRSGPRLVDGIEVLSRIIHPELFDDCPDEEFARRIVRGPVVQDQVGLS